MNKVLSTTQSIDEVCYFFNNFQAFNRAYKDQSTVIRKHCTKTKGKISIFSRKLTNSTTKHTRYWSRRSSIQYEHFNIYIVITMTTTLRF